MSGDAPHLRLRLEPSVMRRLEASRKKSGRTMTGEIAERLEQSFEAEELEAMLRRVLQEAETARVKERYYGGMLSDVRT